jgi:bifunctional DNase/RNase
MGSVEGEAILVLLVGIEVPRPLTYNFAINLLEAAGGQLRQVRVNRLVDGTFFAEAIIDAPDGHTRVVDARPSDAIALALTRRAPIRVAETVMREASQEPDGVARNLVVDGKRVLGKAEIAQEMERFRIQRDTDVQQAVAESRARRASSQNLT